MKPLRYILNLVGVMLVMLLVSGGSGLTWLAYKQANDYLHPRRQLPPDGALLRENHLHYEEIELVTSDGIRLAAWYTPPDNGMLILVAHGYGDRRPEEFYALFGNHGFGVLAWDFRAHGASGGELVSMGYYETLDIEAALAYALAQPEVHHVGAWGGSMGAVTLIRAAARNPRIEALVADSPFTTLEDELDLRVPFPLLNPLIRFFAERETGLRLGMVNALEDIPHISPRPVFLIQGLADTMVPFNSAQRLYAAAREPRQLWMEADVPHLNMYSYYETRYTERVIKFFHEYLPGN
jgi:fermentation-respiration switch protein FrsA (DUF1100 family)